MSKANILFKDSFIIECAVIESLILLVPFDPNECFRHIQAWLIKIRDRQRDGPKLAKSSEQKIKYALNIYKNDLPNYINIVFKD